MEDIILLGMGGHAHSVVDSIEQSKEYRIIGFLDFEEKKTEKFRQYRVLDTDRALKRFYDKGVRNAFVTVGYMGNGDIRKCLYQELKSIGYKLPNIIDSFAIVANDVVLDEGIYIGKGAIINANVQIDKMCIVNSGAIIEHDCRINEYTHIAVGSVLCGQVSVGNNTLIGANSTIIQGLNIGNKVIVGAGTVITKNIADEMIKYGNIEKRRI